MSSLLEILDIVSYVSTAIVVITFIIGLAMWSRGIMPALFRLGKGLSGRKIAIFASSDQAESLEKLLLDSKLFNKKNIVRVQTSGDVGRAEGITLFLVYWPDWADHIDSVLRRASDNVALIVYAPKTRLSDEQIDKLNEYRYFTLVNARGRLLNDVVTSMITTSY